MSKTNFLKLFLSLIITLLVLISACTPTPEADREPPTEIAPDAESSVLNIHNWYDYIDESILTDFEEKFGITINYTNFESNEELIDELMAGPVDYDLVVPSDYAVEILRNEGIFGSLDKSNIPNFTNLSPTFINPAYDPGNRYCIPYQWGTTGIGYNIQATGIEITGWNDVFNPSFKGRIALLDDPRETLGAILLYLGYSPNTTNQLQINEAVEFLKTNSALIARYIADSEEIILATGEIDIAHEYSGEVFVAMEEYPEFHYVIPKEGAMIWSDNLCLLADAPNKENAEKFLNYLLEAEVGAALSNYLRYATPNQASLPLINEADRNNPALYPTNEVLARLFFFADVGSATKLYEDAWNDVISSHGNN